MVNLVKPSRRPVVIASITMATFMAAMEGTIVATAMPSIVGELGGFRYYSWVFSAFLLAQSTTIVIYGKLADLFGRKPTLIAGIVLLMMGSLACGFAWSMPSLVAFRLLQGIGAGAIYPITATMVGDLYKIEERGRVQGMMAGVWALSAVLGPLAGGLIVDNYDWAWIFWINLPIGTVTIVGLALFLHEAVESHRRRIDYIGAALFSISIGSLLLMLTETEAGPFKLSTAGLVFLGTGAWFLFHERRTPEPLVSIELWARRLVATSNAATLLSGMAFIALTISLPIYVQGVMGRSAVIAGLALTALVVAWPLAVMLSGRLYRAIGIRSTLRIGSIMFPIGSAFLLFLSPQTHPLVAGAGSFLIGGGVGLMSITSIALVQDSVEWSIRGSATASFIFARSLGNTVGASAVGAVLNMGLAHFGSGELAAGTHKLLSQQTGLIHLSTNPTIRSVLDQALRWTFFGVLALAILALVATWLIPVESRSAGQSGRNREVPPATAHIASQSANGNIEATAQFTKDC